ncbi:MAG: PAS domain S-box protein [Ferruginibacter sp.]
MANLPRILCDYSLPEFDGSSAFKIRQELASAVPFIFVSGKIGEEISVEFIRNGLTDYVLKDKLFSLATKVQRALKDAREKRQKDKTARELVFSEKRLARAQELAHMGSWELDLATSMVLLSDEACRIYGLDVQQNQQLFEDWISFNEPGEVAFVLKKITSCHEELNDSSFYHRIILRNGATRHIYSECRLGFDLNGSPASIYGIVHDVTAIKLAEEQKEFEKNNLEALINNTNDLMWSVDTDFNLITSNQVFNDAVRKISGKTIEKGEHILSIGLSPEQAKRYRIAYERAFTGESFTEIEYTGTPVESWSEISYYPIRKGSEVIGTACHSRDVTERKKAEENDRFKINLLNTIGQSVIATDLNGIIIFWNNAAQNLYGWSAGEAMGKNITDITPAQQTREEAKEIMQKLSQGQNWAGEFIVQRKDLTSFPAFVADTPMYNQQGVITGVIGVSSDITERKMIEEKLAINQSRLKQAQAIAHIGSWEIDLVANTHFWSDEIYEMFGISKSDVLPSEKAFMAFFHPDDLACSYEKIDEGFKTSQNISFDFRYIPKGGSARYGYNEWQFKFDKNGHPERLFGIMQDVTERKLAEIERIKMVNDLVTRNKDLEQFAYIISHNLRAPVANIIGVTNILDDPNLPAEEKGILQRGLNESVKRLDDVIKDLNHILQVKRTINETKEKVGFAKMVDDIRLSIKNLSDSIEIKYDFSEIGEMLTLKSYLQSIFYNLISNSIRYRRQDIPGVLEIKSQVSNGQVIFTFTDNGMGIDLSKKGDQVFGLYKRFHLNVEGKGMGLFMVKTQVETLGGKISIKSEVNKGTEFKIEFEL